MSPSSLPHVLVSVAVDVAGSLSSCVALRFVAVGLDAGEPAAFNDLFPDAVVNEELLHLDCFAPVAEGAVVLVPATERRWPAPAGRSS